MLLVHQELLIWGNMATLMLITITFLSHVSPRMYGLVLASRRDLEVVLPTPLLSLMTTIWPFGIPCLANLMLLLTLAADVFAWVQYRTEIYKHLLARSHKKKGHPLDLTVRPEGEQGVSPALKEFERARLESLVLDKRHPPVDLDDEEDDYYMLSTMRSRPSFSPGDVERVRQGLRGASGEGITGEQEGGRRMPVPPALLGTEKERARHLLRKYRAGDYDDDLGYALEEEEDAKRRGSAYCGSPLDGSIGRGDPWLHPAESHYPTRQQVGQQVCDSSGRGARWGVLRDRQSPLKKKRKSSVDYPLPKGGIWRTLFHKPSEKPRVVEHMSALSQGQQEPPGETAPTSSKLPERVSQKREKDTQSFFSPFFNGKPVFGVEVDTRKPPIETSDVPKENVEQLTIVKTFKVKPVSNSASTSSAKQLSASHSSIRSEVKRVKLPRSLEMEVKIPNSETPDKIKEVDEDDTCRHSPLPARSEAQKIKHEFMFVQDGREEKEVKTTGQNLPDAFEEKVASAEPVIHTFICNQSATKSQAEPVFHTFMCKERTLSTDLERSSRKYVRAKRRRLSSPIQMTNTQEESPDTNFEGEQGTGLRTDSNVAEEPPSTKPVPHDVTSCPHKSCRSTWKKISRKEEQ